MPCVFPTKPRINLGKEYSYHLSSYMDLTLFLRYLKALPQRNNCRLFFVHYSFSGHGQDMIKVWTSHQTAVICAPSPATEALLKLCTSLEGIVLTHVPVLNSLDLWDTAASTCSPAICNHHSLLDENCGVSYTVWEPGRHWASEKKWKQFSSVECHPLLLISTHLCISSYPRLHFNVLVSDRDGKNH